MIKIVVLLTIVPTILSINILYINVLWSPSHHIWHYAMIKGLNDKGHNVTLMEPMVSKNPATDLYHPLIYEGPPVDFDQEEIGFLTTWGSFHFFHHEMTKMCDYFLKSKELKHILENKDLYKYELIITDLTVAPCTLPLVHEYSHIPVIGVSPFLLPPDLSYHFGNNFQPAYLPHFFTVATDDMSFFQRMENVITTYMGLYLQTQFTVEFDQIVRNRLGPGYPSTLDLMRKISLLICNHNAIFDYPQPLPPNIIPAGGLQAQPAKKLPEDLQKIMDGAKHGVIIFSLGTNVRSDQLGKEKQTILINAFKQLKQTVVWKFESDFKNLPPNVKVLKWLPQNDVIAHPNTCLFIGHGGALSTQEAFYHGVPMVGVPFFFDQFINVQTLKARKRGLMIDFLTMTTESVLETIQEALNNPIYRKNMQDVSKRFKDLPAQPLSNAIAWIEYALKHNGTSFLDLKSRDMTFWQHSCLDVVLTLLALALITLLITIFVVKTVVKFIVRSIFSKRKTD